MPGCDKPAVLEHIVNFFPGPYLCKCLLFSSVFGVPLLLLTRFLDTLKIEAALEVFGPLTWQNVLTFCFANFVLLFYAAYGSRYMRARILTTFRDLDAKSVMSTNRLQEVFTPVCKLSPAIVLSALIAIASIASFPDQWQHAAGPISLAQVIISFPIVYLAYGTFVWVYGSSIKSLHDLGKNHLKLAEFYDDHYLGMKPFGSLSLSLARVYFSGMVLIFFSFIAIPTPLGFVVGILVLAGVAMFFLPSIVIHQKMLDKKREERKKLRSHYNQITASLGDPIQIVTLADAKSLRRILALDIIDRQVDSIPTWPFNLRTLTWLSAIILAVLGSIITKYLLVNIGL